MNTQQQCEFLEGCPIFQYFNRTAKHVYINMYCKGDFHTCERYKLRVDGEAVPEGLLPNGVYLWDQERS